MLERPTLLAVLFLLPLLTMTVRCLAEAGGRRERRTAALEESRAIRNAPGGETFKVTRAYESVYGEVLNFLKRQNYTIASSSRETGQITTGIEITGGWKQKGRTVFISLLDEGDGRTTLRAAVSIQKRYKALQTEPWSEPKSSPPESLELARRLQASLEESAPSK